MVKMVIILKREGQVHKLALSFTYSTDVLTPISASFSSIINIFFPSSSIFYILNPVDSL